jgi:hydrogenase nickel incorporation protein HypA/HybF
MHEMGIALQIMEIAKSSLPAGMEDIRVGKVNLKIGRLAAVVPASLRFCFEVVSKDTPFAGSTLDIKEVPVVVKCRSCRNEWTVTGPDFRCKTCQDGEVDILSGREIDIISLEVADNVD